MRSILGTAILSLPEGDDAPTDAEWVRAVVVPLMLFTGLVDGEPVSCVVGWDSDEGRFVCEGCSSYDCEHVGYVDRVRIENGGEITVLTDKDLSAEIMEDLMADPARLREFMLQRVPVVDIANPDWHSPVA